jgi:DNA-directed RNA polymerase sigma subunit (sigma70/sigma32)
VRIPVHVQALYSKYKKLRQKLEYERGEMVSDEEIASMLKVRSSLGVPSPSVLRVRLMRMCRWSLHMVHGSLTI